MLKSYEPQGGAGKADGEIPLPEDDALNPLAKKAAAVTPMPGAPPPPLPLPGIRAVGALGGPLPPVASAGGHEGIAPASPRSTETETATLMAGAGNTPRYLSALAPPPVAGSPPAPPPAAPAPGTPSLTGPAVDPNAAQNEWTQRAIGNVPGRAVDAAGNVFDDGIGGIPLGNVNDPAFNPATARAAYNAEQARKANPATQDWTPEALARQKAGWNVIPTGNGGFRYELTSSVDPSTVSGVVGTAEGQQTFGTGKLPGSVFEGLMKQTSTGPKVAATPSPLPGAPPAAPAPGTPPIPGVPSPSPVPGTAGLPGPAPALPPAGTPTPRSMVAPNTAPTLTSTDPNNPLTGQTIDFGPLADRFKVAQSELENWNKTTDPQFQADLRRAMQKAAAGGALGSGMLQTGLGDIALNRETQRQGMGTSFLNNALTGTIGDAKDRAALAERQQGFQAGQQGTAFNQAVTQAQLEDQLTGNQFQRELQKLIAGSSGNPADIQLALSNIFGNAGSDASNALSGLISGKTANSGAGAQTNYFADLLKQLLGGGGGDTTMTPAATTVYGGQ